MNTSLTSERNYKHPRLHPVKRLGMQTAGEVKGIPDNPSHIGECHYSMGPLLPANPDQSTRECTAKCRQVGDWRLPQPSSRLHDINAPSGLVGLPFEHHRQISRLALVMFYKTSLTLCFLNLFCKLNTLRLHMSVIQDSMSCYYCRIFLYEEKEEQCRKLLAPIPPNLKFHSSIWRYENVK